MHKTKRTFTFGISDEQFNGIHELSHDNYKDFTNYLRDCVSEFLKTKHNDNKLITDEELECIKKSVEQLGMKIVKDLN